MSMCYSCSEITKTYRAVMLTYSNKRDVTSLFIQEEEKDPKLHHRNDLGTWF